jgi:hypothetical protein
MGEDMNGEIMARARADMLATLGEIDEGYPLLDGLVYRSFYGFVLAHGRFYDRKPWTAKYPRMVEKQCFGNAIYLGGLYGLRYVEGFAVSPVDGDAFLHGWNIDENNLVVDSTWCNTGVLYLGVEFSVERADDASWNGDACVLNDCNRHYPVLQRTWEGEDYNLAWPASDRLEHLRRGARSIAPSVEAWMKQQRSLAESVSHRERGES